MYPDPTHRGRLLYVALGFLGLDVPPATMPPELRTLHAWLDSWHGIGLIAQGLARQDRDLSLTRYGDRWGASVFVTGKEHAIVQGDRLADDPVGGGPTGRIPCAAPRRFADSLARRVHKQRSPAESPFMHFA
jgi:hypothetical protein